MSNLKPALNAGKRGWHIYPIVPGTKRSLIPDPLNAATTDEKQIREWWTKWPNANIGVNCGKSGLVVLDVDTKKGKQGAKSLLDLLEGDFMSPLLDTLNAHSWSGGRHYFYKGECGSSNSKLAPDLDVKGINGAVVIAPSFVEEDGLVGQYRWADPGEGEKWPIRDFPDLFRPKETKKAPIREVVQFPDGGRHDGIVSLAGWYCRLGLTPSAREAALQADNLEKCKPPLDPKEVAQIAKSAKWAADPKASEASKPPPSPNEYRFRTAAELLELASERVDWIVEDLIRQSGLCLFSARPGAGKSTLMRSLAACVSTGSPFLSRRCKKGKVAWVGMEESRADLLDALEDMGLLENDQIVYATGSDIPPAGSAADRLDWLEAFIKHHEPRLVIIDTLGAFFEIEDINHYSSTSKAMNPLLALRDRYSTAFLLLHHTKIGADVALGSTKILASFDVSLVMTVSPQGTRALKTDKMRCGVPLEDTVLLFDAETRQMAGSEPKWVSDKRICEQNILDYLKPGMLAGAQELANRSGRKGGVARSAVASLVSQGLLEVSGSGTKGDPKKYALLSLQEHGWSAENGSDHHAPCVSGNLDSSDSSAASDSSDSASHTYGFAIESEESEESEAFRSGLVRSSPKQSEEIRGNPNNPKSPRNPNNPNLRSHDQFRLRTQHELPMNGSTHGHADVEVRLEAPFFDEPL